MPLLTETKDGPKLTIDLLIDWLGKDQIKNIVLSLPGLLDQINQQNPMINGVDQLNELYLAYLTTTESEKGVIFAVFRMIFLYEVILGETNYLAEEGNFITEQSDENGKISKFVTTTENPFTMD